MLFGFYMLTNFHAKMSRLIFLIYFISSIIFSQKLDFQKIGPEKGLDISQIFSLVQLDNNLIAAGTFGGGIYFFNGTEFFKMGVKEGLTNNKILNMALSPDGDLWIATRFGVSRYDGSEFTNFSDSSGLSNNIVNRLYITKEGSVYAGTNNGLDVYRPSDKPGKFENIINGKRVFGVYVSEDETIWAGTATGLYIINNGTVDSTRFKELEGVAINAVKPGPENKIFICSEEGLFLINGENVTKWDKNSGLPSNYISDIIISSKGIIWVGTNYGLSRISGDRIRNFGEKEGINNFMIWSILEDNENNIWFGTDDGLFKLSSYEFEVFLDPDGKTILSWYIKRDKWGTLWAGVHHKGLLKMEEGKFKWANTNPYIKGNSIDYIYQDRSGYLWFCGYGGIARYDGSEIMEFFPNSELSNLEVNSVVETENGDVWFGTWEARLYKYSNGRLTFVLEGDYPFVFMTEYRGILYFATPGGLFYMSGEGPAVPDWAQPLIAHDLTSLLAYNDDQLLMAAYDLGVVIANFGNDGKVVLDTINVNDGLNDNSVLAIAADGNKDLWAGTNKGLNRIKMSNYKPGNKISVNSFGYDDGIAGSEFLQKAMYYDSSGYMWFGTISGLARFRPSEIGEKKIYADIQFTDFMYTVRGQQFNINPNFLRNRLIGNQEIEIPSTESDISLSFAATHFRDPAGIKYRYRINGGNWSRFSKQRNIMIPDLSHGSYTITVEAKGNWNTTIKPADITLVIPTPFWKTVLFQIFLGVGIALLMLWAYRLRTTKIRERQKDLEERLAERELYQDTLARQYQEIKTQKEKAEESDKIKSEFLAQVSHEIRTPLQVMLNHTSLLKDHCKNNDELMDSFSKIDSSGLRLIRTIDSILNMSQIQAGALEVHPKKLDLSGIVKKITEEFKPHANAKNLELKCNMNHVDTTAVLDEYTVSHLVQNLIDNAIKYTDKGSVNISVDRNGDGKLFLEVRDTGIGISENYLKNLFSPFSQEDSGYTRKFEGAGLGLSLVKNYCDLNSAEIFVESEKGKGSKFTVLFKT